MNTIKTTYYALCRELRVTPRGPDFDVAVSFDDTSEDALRAFDELTTILLNPGQKDSQPR